jgi:hypothetical protein
MPRAGNIVTLKVILELSDRTREALIRAHRQLTQDDEEINENEYPENP